MADKVKLDIAVAEYPHTKAILSGEIPIEGVEANFIRVHPQIGAYRRMVRQVEFDVCELAPTTYIIARGYGAPFVGLPIFVTRRFHHSGLLVRPEAGIKGPKDLEGRKVGVRAYSVTTGVWTRGIYMEEYGLDSSKVTWVVDDEEHVTQMKLPPNVIHAPDGKSLIYASERGGKWQILEARHRDEEPYFFASTVITETPVVSNTHENDQPRYSPDGKELAFVEDRNTEIGRAHV